MKFAIAVVLCALVLGVQSSIIPLAYTAVHGPALVHGIPHAAIIDAHHPHAAVAVHAAPVHVVHAAPVVVAVAPAEATYVAKTRGSVHVAPLPGHSNSAASVNLEPAPGTA